MKYIKTILAFITLALATCIFTPLPAAEKIESCVAIRPHATASDRAGRIWGEFFWPQRATLHVRFLSGSAGQKNEAWKRFVTIDKLINLTFVRVDSGHTDLRVAFDPNSGHWSYVGTGNRSVSRSRPTMNLALKAGLFGDGTTEWNRVALHEICHAIGMNHEHQHPLSSIKWNVPVVIAYYRRTQGWSEQETRFQVLNRAPMTGKFRGTAFDPESLMEYPIAPELTLDRFSVGWNSKLSRLDILFLSQVYPP